MLAAPVAELPAADSCPGGCRYEMKLDGWRLISFGDYKGHVYLQSRIGKPLTTYFPEIARVVREYLPRDVVVDGELVVLDPDGTRTSFVLLQRRIVAGVRPLQLARETPAHYVVFDLLQEGGRELLSWPLSDRRARLAELVADAPPQLTLCPQTGDADVADDWRTDWAAAGTIEGLVIKGARSRYTPGSRRGWRKYRVHESTDAIVGGVTGSRSRPESVLVGRFDPDGRLRYLGRTNTLTAHQAAELAPLLAPPTPRRRGGIQHPWPRPLPAAWSAQFTHREPLGYLQVQPIVVVEIEVDAAAEYHRWRHGARYLRVRNDVSIYDVPLAV